MITEVQPNETLDGRLQIEGLISPSGMASIYKAKDLMTGQAVAVKVPHQQFESDPASFARFQREAEIGKKLNHPKILRLLDVGEHSRPYIVMKYAIWTFAVKTRTLLAGMMIVLLLTLGSVQAENMSHDRLVALVSDPGSDLSGLQGGYNLHAAAALDARLYFQKHNNREYGKDCLGIGLEHAVKHHLKGRAVDVYALAFDAACRAFLAK